MRLNIITRYIGLVLILNALFMLLAAGISLYNSFDTGFYPLLLSFTLTMALGAFPLIFVDADNNISTKEGYLIVVGAWVISCFVGTFPYLLWGGEFDVMNAWFESVSGFTTTGSTILEDVERLPRSLLFWRSSTHWLGGIGVVMFVMIIIPSLGRVKTLLSNVQMSALARENFKYKTQKIIRILLTVYVGLTFLQTVALKIAGMNWFDALNHSFSTVATGGFSTHTLSIAYYQSPLIEAVITIFMVIAGLHFGLIFATISGKKNNVFRSEVSKLYLMVLAGAGVAVSLSLWISEVFPSAWESFRHGIFQVVSVCTTTGFATTDSNYWTPFAVIILIILSFTCACSGSTTGGLKIDRILISYKSLLAKVKQLQHPNAVIRVKIDGVIVDNDTMGSVNLFIVIYLVSILAGTLFISMLGIDIMTSFSAAFASMGNVGPGFGGVASLCNYSALPDAAKLVCTTLMLIGRLEIFGLLQIIMFKFWK